MSKLIDNAKQYLLTHCSSCYELTNNPEEYAVIGWKPIELPKEFAFLSESFEAVEPIKIPGLKEKPNAIAYRVRFDELFEHYKKYETEKHGSYLFLRDFKVLLWKSFPNLRHTVERVEYMRRNKDGHHIIDQKTGKIETFEVSYDIILGIQFYPDGLQAV